jgi:hypothetical protein
MSVDDRLRRGLEVNALSLTPEPEARLDAVHRRQRRRRLVVAAASAVVVLGACAATAVAVDGGDGTSPQPVVPAPTPSPPSSTTDVPTGTWERVITIGDARSQGFSRSQARGVLGPDGRLPERVSLTADSFSEEAQDQPGVYELGDYGSLRTEQDRLVLVSSSPGCPGCGASLRWRVVGDRLVLSEMQGRSVRPIDRLMFEGVYTPGDR